MLSRRLVVFLLLAGSLAGALITGRDLFYNLLYLWLALVAIAGVWTWTSLGRIRVARQTRTLRTQVGGMLEERLAVRNQSNLPKLWLEVRDQSDLPGHQPSRVIVGLGSQQERVWVARTRAVQRGRFRLGPLSITSGDPFGLFQVSRNISATNQVVVFPATTDLPNFPLPVGIAPGGDALRRRTHYVTPNAAGVRDYSSGDSFNRIHWRTSARRDRLMVKEFELDPLADVWLFLDGERAVQAGNATVATLNENDPWYKRPDPVRLPPSTEEYAVSLTASLAQHFLRRDRSVGMVAYGETREVVQPDRSERQLTKILETLAVFRASGRLRLVDALRLELEQLPRGATVMLVTATSDVSWIGYVQALKRRSVNTVSFIVNPASFGGQQNNAGLVQALWAVGLPAYAIHNNVDFAAALAGGR
ncbi:MAG: DUF58 domain-containing protein [Anaerolineales bacterium]